MTSGRLAVAYLQEQQLFYKEITEACVGSDENKRTVGCSILSRLSVFYGTL